MRRNQPGPVSRTVTIVQMHGLAFSNATTLLPRQQRSLRGTADSEGTRALTGSRVAVPAAEQSSSAGVLLSDALHLRDGGEPVPFVFGCETQVP